MFSRKKLCRLLLLEVESTESVLWKRVCGGKDYSVKKDKFQAGSKRMDGEIGESVNVSNFSIFDNFREYQFESLFYASCLL